MSTVIFRSQGDPGTASNSESYDYLAKHLGQQRVDLCSKVFLRSYSVQTLKTRRVALPASGEALACPDAVAASHAGSEVSSRA